MVTPLACSPMAVGRVDPPFIGDERELFIGFLDCQRVTVRWKCEGRTEAQLRSRALPPST